MIRIEHLTSPIIFLNIISWNEKSKFILSLVLAENTKDLVAFLLNTHTQVNVLS